MIKNIRLLSIDPGRKTGFAFFSGDNLKKYGVVCVNNIKDLTHTIGELIQVHLPNNIAIEDQYLASNFYSVKKLIEIRATIETIASLKEIKVHRIHPSTWISKMLGRRYIKLKRKEILEAALRTVNLLYDVKTDIDSAAAILIGRYAVGQILWRNIVNINENANPAPLERVY